MITLTALAFAAAPLTPGAIVDCPKPGGFDYMTVDAKYHRVFASHEHAGTLAVLDLDTMKVREIDTGVVNGIEVVPSLDRVYSGGGGHKLYALDRKTLKILATTALNGPGDDLVVDTKRKQVIMCHDDGTEDWVFDAETLKPIRSITIAGAPEFVLYEPHRDKIYQNIKPTNQLQVIDPDTGTVSATWETGTMTSPHGLAIDGRLGLAMSAGRNGKLDVFSLDSGKLIQTVEVTSHIDQIAYDPALHRLYCPGNGKMSVLNITKSGATLIGDVDIPAGVHTLAVDPTTHDVWVSYGDTTSAHLQQFKVSS